MKATGIDRIKVNWEPGAIHISTQEDKVTNDNDSTLHEHKTRKGMNYNGISGGIYGMAFLGALVYYLQQATSFWTVVLGIFKAIFWPAVLMYKVLELLGM